MPSSPLLHLHHVQRLPQTSSVGGAPRPMLSTKSEQTTAHLWVTLPSPRVWWDKPSILMASTPTSRYLTLLHLTRQTPSRSRPGSIPRVFPAVVRALLWPRKFLSQATLISLELQILKVLGFSDIAC